MKKIEREPEREQGHGSIELGLVWYKGNWRYFNSFHEVTRGKFKGQLKININEQKIRVDKEDVRRFPLMNLLEVRTMEKKLAKAKLKTESLPVDDKPKRKRRTKAEMTAVKMAAARMCDENKTNQSKSDKTEQAICSLEEKNIKKDIIRLISEFCLALHHDLEKLKKRW